MSRILRCGLAWLVLILFVHPVFAEPDLSEYRTIDKAISAKLGKENALSQSQKPFLGLLLTTNTNKQLIVEDVLPDSPVAKAQIQRHDQLLQVQGKAFRSEPLFQEFLSAQKPGDQLAMTFLRDGKSVEVTVTLESLSKPVKSVANPINFGVQVSPVKDGDGVIIDQVTPNSLAERAKLKAGEILLKIDDTELKSMEALQSFLATKKREDTVTLTMLLAEKRVEMKLALEDRRFPPQGWDTRMTRYWTKPKYRVAIIGVEYPDVKHNPKITPKAWEESMFSKGTYKTSATGQTTYGSMHDYYWEQSYGQLNVEGKAFDYVEVEKKRAEYDKGNRYALLTEAMDKLLAREGKEALKDFDGVFFIYAGDRFPAARGSLYWPHRASVLHNGKRWPYFICPEGGARMGNISVFCHEFGHMLGLPDLYARPENPGMEGVGIWCAMANQAGGGRPQHFSAWCKEKLGWIKPTVIDPTVKQKLILAPIEESPKDCLKVLVRPDGSEYFLLENRKKKGFDTSLPAEGLLIWRIVGNRPILEESHGVEGPSGPRMFMSAVPYPSGANDAFTPFTTPSSRSQLGGGLPVYITNIQRLPDGRITLQIGYEYQ